MSEPKTDEEIKEALEKLKDVKPVWNGDLGNGVTIKTDLENGICTVTIPGIKRAPSFVMYDE